MKKNNKCEACGWIGQCHRHRIKQGKDGGKYTPKNVIILCPTCHKRLHSFEFQIYKDPNVRKSIEKMYMERRLKCLTREKKKRS